MVHLELHTGNLARACAFYAELCGWRPERIDCPRGSYQSLAIGNGLDGGIVECETGRPLWLPYVEVARGRRRHRPRPASWAARFCSSRARAPPGWRSVVVAPSGGEIAFWQPKSPADR